MGIKGEVIWEGVLMVIGAIGLVIGVSMLLALPFMWIWNYAVVSALTVAKPIGFWPSYWVMVFFMFFVRSSSGSSNK